MVGLIRSAEYWRLRAGEAHAVADGMTDLKAREAVLKIANDYDALALMAEEQANLIVKSEHGEKQ